MLDYLATYFEIFISEKMVSYCYFLLPPLPHSIDDFRFIELKMQLIFMHNFTVTEKEEGCVLQSLDFD